MTRLRGD